MEPRNSLSPAPSSAPVPPAADAAGDGSDFPSQAALAADQEGCCSPATCEG